MVAAAPAGRLRHRDDSADSVGRLAADGRRRPGVAGRAVTSLVQLLAHYTVFVHCWRAGRPAFFGLTVLGFYGARLVASALWIYPIGIGRPDILSFPVAICLFAAGIHSATAAGHTVPIVEETTNSRLFLGTR